MPVLYKEIKEKVIQSLEDMDTISITTDGWSTWTLRCLVHTLNLATQAGLKVNSAAYWVV